jgi:uncharacterized membrane protein YvlD (DUF360 family)
MLTWRALLLFASVAVGSSHRQHLHHPMRIPRGGGGKEVIASTSVQGRMNLPKSLSVDQGPQRASRKILQSMRLLYLSYYASQGALMPYLPVYFHSLGHAGSAIGLLGAIRPITTFLVAPLWGILSDLYDDHVSTLQFAFVSSLVFQCLVGVGNAGFNYIMVMAFINAILSAPVKSLIDSIVMSKLTSEEDRYQFGRMRLWGQIGFGVGSSIVGCLLRTFPATNDNDTTRNNSIILDTKRLPVIKMLLNFGSGLRGYELAFFSHAILSIPVFFCIRAFRPEKSVPSTIIKSRDGNYNNQGDTVALKKDRSTTDISEGFRLLSKNKDALVFFFLVFVIGTSSGCIENFAYVRVREVGGTGTNMGILRLVSSLAGAPMFWYSGPMTEKLGTDVVLVLSLLAYSIRFFNYAWMTHPYHALPAEALRGLTFALFWSAGSTYAHKISPTGMKATMLLIMNAMYGGLGQSLGAIIGGKLQSTLGTVQTFVLSGLFDASFVVALVAYLASGSKRAFSTSSIHP